MSLDKSHLVAKVQEKAFILLRNTNSRSRVQIRIQAQCYVLY